MMARERERVFSLSKFSTLAETENGDQEETHTNIFSRIYGANEAGYGTDKKNTQVADDSSDAEYVEPARTSYPENGVLNKFGARKN